MNIIQISVGDWSNDGHGMFDQFWYCIEDNLEVKDVREAFFKSQSNYPNLDPTKFCDEYLDDQVPSEIKKEAVKKGLSKRVIENEDFYTEQMAAYVVWFIGLSGVKLTRVETEDIPTLHFYGHDEKNRYAPFFGYGLFKD